MEQHTSRDLPPEEETSRPVPSAPERISVDPPDGNPPPVIDEGENPDLYPFPSPESPSYADMTGSGRIIFQVSTASGAIPLEGVQVTVREHYAGGTPGPNGDTLAVLYTGNDGKTDPLTLPAPARVLSMEQAPNGAPLPFALYDAEVIRAGYYRQEYTRIPLFDGVTSIQRVDLVPLPSASAPDQIGQPRRDITEGVRPNL